LPRPNADIEVFDKFTGELAFRVAPADQTTIDAAIAATVGYVAHRRDIGRALSA
jgi:hypothetical protein